MVHVLKFINAVLAKNKTKFSLKGYSESFINLLVEFLSKFYKEDLLSVTLIKCPCIDCIGTLDITKEARRKLDWYLMEHKNFVEKWIKAYETI